jgi:NAD(P)-dependent dehydrogenase (short-subunit alcohol dehydrogenase family)
MDLRNCAVLVTGGASGLGLATARRLAVRGASVTLLDLPSSAGTERAAELGPDASFAAGDVTDPESVAAAVDAAAARGPLRAVIHCAGRGGTVRIVERDGSPGPMELFETVVRVNLFGTYNVLRYAAARMAENEPVDGDRGVIVLTASVAAFEGQIGQLPYAASKAGIVGMTIVAARDLARRFIRVCTIAPGVFDTPILGRFSQEFKDGLGAAAPHPSRLGQPDEFARLAEQIVDNPMLNGETIRLDGAIRMAPR